MAYQSRIQIVSLVAKDIRARDIITVESLKNAIRMDMAVAASSNLILHIPAIANEAGMICPGGNILMKHPRRSLCFRIWQPSGPYSLKDFDLAGVCLQC